MKPFFFTFVCVPVCACAHTHACIHTPAHVCFLVSVAVSDTARRPVGNLRYESQSSAWFETMSLCCSPLPRPS